MRTKIKDLKLADTIQLDGEAFSTAIVTQVTDERVTLFRPYATTADFSYTGGVIPYIGIETFDLFRYETREVMVIARKELR